jgi:hypothetical protein
MQIGPMATKLWSTIIKETSNERVVVCHKLTSDGSALTMMCERNEKPQPTIATRWRFVMACTCYRAMDMHYQ